MSKHCMAVVCLRRITSSALISIMLTGQYKIHKYIYNNICKHIHMHTLIIIIVVVIFKCCRYLQPACRAEPRRGVGQLQPLL